MAAEGVCLDHISRESTDINRLAKFYHEILGFEETARYSTGEFEAIFLRLPPMFSMHLIQKAPESRLPEGPWSSTSAIADPILLPRGHHICVSISNFDSFVTSLKEIGIESFEKIQPDGITKQVFFFDPDGNGLEVASREDP